MPTTKENKAKELWKTLEEKIAKCKEINPSERGEPLKEIENIINDIQTDYKKGVPIPKRYIEQKRQEFYKLRDESQSQI